MVKKQQDFIGSLELLGRVADGTFPGHLALRFSRGSLLMSNTFGFLLSRIPSLKIVKRMGWEKSQRSLVVFGPGKVPSGPGKVPSGREKSHRVQTPFIKIDIQGFLARKSRIWQANNAIATTCCSYAREECVAFRPFFFPNDVNLRVLQT